MKATHMYICGAVMMVVLLLVALGSDAWVMLAPLGCIAMMAGMMWMMMRAGHHR